MTNKNPNFSSEEMSQIDQYICKVVCDFFIKGDKKDLNSFEKDLVNMGEHRLGKIVISEFHNGQIIINIPKFDKYLVADKKGLIASAFFDEARFDSDKKLVVKIKGKEVLIKDRKIVEKIQISNLTKVITMLDLATIIGLLCAVFIILPFFGAFGLVVGGFLGFVICIGVFGMALDSPIAVAMVFISVILAVLWGIRFVWRDFINDSLRDFDRKYGENNA